MPKVEIFNIEESLGRIDKALVTLMSLSRSQIQQLLKKDCVVVNGEIAKANQKLQVGDEVKVSVPDPETIDLIPENIPLTIVYEDEAIVVIDKVSGMVVHPSMGHPNGTLVNALLYHVKNLATSTGEIRPGIVHRIDKDTSGLLVVAKTTQAHELLSQQFQTHDIKREYVALVHGEITHESGTIDAPLARDKHDRLKWSVQEGGKRAVTHFRVLERFEGYTLVSLMLETGRTHQIRAHMHFIGHDLVGEPVYSNHHDDKTFGQLLHAKTLGFQHPITQEFLLFDSELPDFFKEYLSTLQSSQK